ncbi:MAG TPA: aminoacyl-tRNA hydrolase, partial [Thermoanaerobacterales bacterium]|nr:aminoacyl-tRNA hydrolase [Thermoanaerobacterales bacterium]
MYVVVGLGNPGNEYRITRHNIGFLSIDYFAEKNKIKINKLKYKALIGKGKIGDKDIMLVKPQTYMNLSGRSIKDIL